MEEGIKTILCGLMEFWQNKAACDLLVMPLDCIKCLPKDISAKMINKLADELVESKLLKSTIKDNWKSVAMRYITGE